MERARASVRDEVCGWRTRNCALLSHTDELFLPHATVVTVSFLTICSDDENFLNYWLKSSEVDLANSSTLSQTASFVLSSVSRGTRRAKVICCRSCRIRERTRPLRQSVVETFTSCQTDSAVAKKLLSSSSTCTHRVLFQSQKLTFSFVW